MDKNMMVLGKRTLRALARRFPAVPPASVKAAFDEALQALYLDPKEYRLIYIPTRAVNFAMQEGGFGKMTVGRLGLAYKKTAYVVQSHYGREDERITAIHEAQHFKFGPHPWPDRVSMD